VAAPGLARAEPVAVAAALRDRDAAELRDGRPVGRRDSDDRVGLIEVASRAPALQEPVRQELVLQELAQRVAQTHARSVREPLDPEWAGVEAALTPALAVGARKESGRDAAQQGLASPGLDSFAAEDGWGRLNRWTMADAEAPVWFSVLRLW
jgi:hypothetical protein